MTCPHCPALAERVRELNADAQRHERDYADLANAYTELFDQLAAQKAECNTLRDRLQQRGREIHDLQQIAQRGLGVGGDT